VQAHGSQREGAAPVMADKIDRRADPLELAHEPVDVPFLRGGEARRARAAEARKRERERVGVPELGAKVVPKSCGFGNSVDEDDRISRSKTADRAHARWRDEWPSGRRKSRISAVTRSGASS
jgi:hypothetical protein